jgi:hypothetical protein
MTRCPAHGNRIQQTPAGAVNLFGAPFNQIVVGRADSKSVTGILACAVSMG